MTDTQRSELLAEILQLSGEVEPVRPNEITVADYQQQTGLGHQTCKRALDRLVAQGVLVRRDARNEDGRRVLAYRRAG